MIWHVWASKHILKPLSCNWLILNKLCIKSSLYNTCLIRVWEVLPIVPFPWITPLKLSHQALGIDFYHLSCILYIHFLNTKASSFWVKPQIFLIWLLLNLQAQFLDWRFRYPYFDGSLVVSQYMGTFWNPNSFYCRRNFLIKRTIMWYVFFFHNYSKWFVHAPFYIVYYHASNNHDYNVWIFHY